jgi:hypothetical protein
MTVSVVSSSAASAKSDPCHNSLTPKAFANWSPGLERGDNPGETRTTTVEPCKGYSRTGLTPFGVQDLFIYRHPGLSLRSNRGLKLVNAFGVINRVRQRPSRPGASPSLRG